VIGAGLGTLAVRYSPLWVPAAVLIPIAAVLTGSVPFARHSQEEVMDSR
jgi:hypothetical protein